MRERSRVFGAMISDKASCVLGVNKRWAIEAMREWPVISYI